MSFLGHALNLAVRHNTQKYSNRRHKSVSAGAMCWMWCVGMIRLKPCLCVFVPEDRQLAVSKAAKKVALWDLLA